MMTTKIPAASSLKSCVLRNNDDVINFDGEMVYSFKPHTTDDATLTATDTNETDPCRFRVAAKNRPPDVGVS